MAANSTPAVHQATRRTPSGARRAADPDVIGTEDEDVESASACMSMGDWGEVGTREKHATRGVARRDNRCVRLCRSAVATPVRIAGRRECLCTSRSSEATGATQKQRSALERAAQPVQCARQPVEALPVCSIAFGLECGAGVSPLSWHSNGRKLLRGGARFFVLTTTLTPDGFPSTPS